MLLGVRPLVFLARLLFFFALTFIVWEPLAPLYTKILAWLTQLAISATELFGAPPVKLATTVIGRGDAIFFTHKAYPGYAPGGIPSDWVQANIVLLLPLMLATPAPTWRAKFTRLGIALGVAMLLQVLGLMITIKAEWSNGLGAFSMMNYSLVQRKFYGFADAFFQSFDTQLFPVAIWAGIHFRQLLAWVQGQLPTAPARPAGESRAETRRRKRSEKA